MFHISNVSRFACKYVPWTFGSLRGLDSPCGFSFSDHRKLYSVVNLLTLECILILVVSSLFQYHPKYTSLHLNLNCLKNYRCKNPHLARKESPLLWAGRNKTMLANSGEGNWVCQLTKFLRAMCLGAFFPAPKLFQVNNCHGALKVIWCLFCSVHTFSVEIPLSEINEVVLGF